MRTLIAIILILSAFTSCGKRTKNNTVAISQQGAFLECSYLQVRKQCLDYSDNKRIPPRFFYYRQCYEEYTLCLQGYGY